MNLPSEQKPQPNYPKLLLIVVIVIAILLIAGGLWYWNTSKSTSTTTTPTPNQSSSQSSEIKNDTDLQKAQNDLDNSDPNSLDTALGQNDTDAAQF